MTRLTRSDLPEDLAPLREGIERRVPLSTGGRNRRLHGLAERLAQELEDAAGNRASFYDDVAEHWRLQLGTLGSGNHFIEIVEDRDGAIWGFLHSGSRGVGNRVADHHIRAAQAYCAERGIDLPHRDLAYLEEGTPQFAAYVRDLDWCQWYARENRAVMMDRTLASLSEVYYGSHDMELERVQTIQCHHNFTQEETHFGRRTWVSRKGAISAREGEMGLIPGSMGTRSYVVRGLGDAESFHSAPHGAGRRFSRTEARRRFTMDDFDAAMQGVEVKRDPDFLDEIPAAYKDVDRVIEQSAELVQVVHTFRQIVNVKGVGVRRRRRRKGRKRASLSPDPPPS